MRDLTAFSSPGAGASGVRSAQPTWRILVVDDEPDVVDLVGGRGRRTDLAHGRHQVRRRAVVQA
ncbi:hypothetical protein [Kitasatospora sp. NPDC088346]|uniref:hypothetical protein n=1 Tax=Kitasatospora sp. NPDC088346 TaxID=3364073 RepID=UPI0037F9ABDB